MSLESVVLLVEAEVEDDVAKGHEHAAAAPLRGLEDILAHVDALGAPVPHGRGPSSSSKKAILTTRGSIAGSHGGRLEPAAHHGGRAGSIGRRQNPHGDDVSRELADQLDRCFEVRYLLGGIRRSTGHDPNSTGCSEAFRRKRPALGSRPDVDDTGPAQDEAFPHRERAHERQL